MTPKRLPPAFAVIEAYRLAHPQAARRWLAALPPHCGILIRRAQRAPNFAAVRALTRAARAEHRWVLVGGDWRLAWQAGAGAHFSEQELRRKQRQRPHLPASAAVHSQAALRRALAHRVALIFVSPVFATPSHRGAKGLGVLRFAQWAHALHRLPHAPALYALGGMHAQAWRRLSAARLSPRTRGYAAQRAFAAARGRLRT